MDNIYLNELSLNGQFRSMDEFLDACVPLMKCLKFLQGSKKSIYKHSSFYKQRITDSLRLNDLRGVRNDKARRLKSLLLLTTDNPPYWDLEEELKQDLEAQYTVAEADITATSVAEAAEEDGMLLSFLHNDYQDIMLPVCKNGESLRTISSSVSLNHLSDQLWKREQIDVHKYVKAKYTGTRLDFSQMEEQYGLNGFERDEIRDCIQAFDRFVRRESWEELAKDKGLHYKKYVPNAVENDWFRQERYQDKEIYKFRCGNPKRCFGYRKDNVFYVLRMERDHKISDNG